MFNKSRLVPRFLSESGWDENELRVAELHLGPRASAMNSIASALGRRIQNRHVQKPLDFGRPACTKSKLDSSTPLPTLPDPVTDDSATRLQDMYRLIVRSRCPVLKCKLCRSTPKSPISEDSLKWAGLFHGGPRAN